MKSWVAYLLSGFFLLVFLQAMPSLGQDGLFRPLAIGLKLIGTNYRWPMFAPDVSRYNVRVYGAIEFASGEKLVVWPFKEEGNYFERLSRVTWWSWSNRVAANEKLLPMARDMAFYMKDFAEKSQPSRSKVIKVNIMAEWYEIDPPVVGAGGQIESLKIEDIPRIEKQRTILYEQKF